MAGRRARVRRVESSIHDPVEAHRAGTSANHGSQDKREFCPARPTVIVPGGDHHRRQREGQGEEGVGKLDEGSPLLNY